MKEESEFLTNDWDYFFKFDRPGGYYYLVDADPIRSYIDYARCYVDDIVIFSKIFGQYIEYLDTIFELFDALGIILIDEVYLNLHEDYRIPGIKGKKLTRQRIYPVISVTYLESVPHGKDPYDRSRNDYPSLVEEGAVDPNGEW